MGLPGNVYMQWKPSPRATSYRVRWKADGIGAETTDAGLFTDPAVNLSELPIGVNIIVHVTARNHAGETVPTVLELTAPWLANVHAMQDGDSGARAQFPPATSTSVTG